MSTTERTRWDAKRSKHRSCLDKQPYGEHEARRVARILNDQGAAVHAYPCLFDHRGRYHVGADWSES